MAICEGGKERIAALGLRLRNLEKWLKKRECQESWRKKSVKSYLVYFQGSSVRMNIVRCGPKSSGAQSDNCSREGVYLKD